MIIFELIIFILLLISISFLVGYSLAPKNKTTQPEEAQIRQLKSDIDKLYKLMIGEEPKAPQHTAEEDLGLINSEGVGIVYRPNAEEITKMNEPQKVREAKEAIAQELAREVPPEI